MIMKNESRRNKMRNRNGSPGDLATQSYSFLSYQLYNALLKIKARQTRATSCIQKMLDTRSYTPFATHAGFATGGEGPEVSVARCEYVSFLQRHVGHEYAESITSSIKLHAAATNDLRKTFISTKSSDICSNDAPLTWTRFFHVSMTSRTRSKNGRVSFVL